jgi:hypothetical protein
MIPPRDAVPADIYTLVLTEAQVIALERAMASSRANVPSAQRVWYPQHAGACQPRVAFAYRGHNSASAT